MSVLALLALIGLGPSGLALAAQSSSTNYSVDEVFFGNGGELNACSTNYCAKQSSGELTAGRTGSTNYDSRTGFNTNREEYLQLLIDTSAVDVGVLNSSETHVGEATFSVKAYLADGYQVVSSAPAPTYSGHSFATPGSPTASAVGTEQFGMNLVANACPGTAPSSGPGSCTTTLGADPVQVPDNTFSFGQAATGYNTPDVYQYTNGDVIAESAKSSGETDYTISYIFNISLVTPAGQYHMYQSLVATATF
jgi:hypothetical protein